MLEGIKSDNAKGLIRYSVYCGIAREIDRDNLTIEEKEELVKWYEDNLVIGSATLREMLNKIKGE